MLKHWTIWPIFGLTVFLFGSGLYELGLWFGWPEGGAAAVAVFTTLGTAVSTGAAIAEIYYDD